MSDISWDLLRSFTAVVRTNSLSGAARSLGMTQPTIGRHIEALEEQLGVSLFVRSQLGLAPTSAALDLMPFAETMASASDALVRAASGEGEAETGIVRVTSSEVIGIEVMPDIVCSFHEKYPEIEVELVLSNTLEKLSQREADIAVRMVRPKQQALIAKRMGDTPVLFYAHKRYVDQYGMPDTVDDMHDHVTIGPDSDEYVIQFIRTLMNTKKVLQPSIRTDNQVAQMQLIRSGIGIGGMQKQLADREPDLVPVLPDVLKFPMEMWLAMHEDLRASRRVRVMFEHLAEELGAYVGGE